MFHELWLMRRTASTVNLAEPEQINPAACSATKNVEVAPVIE